MSSPEPAGTQPAPALSEADLRKLAEKVYRLLREDLRLNQARNPRGRPRGGAER